MTAHLAREPRLPVRIGARLRSARGWGEVVIRNVSSRGVMGVCAAPPVRGDSVEIRCGGYVVVARVAWSANDRFGARAQDPIELSDLMSGAREHARAAREPRELPQAEHVAPRRLSLVGRAAASRRIGRALDFIAVALAGAALATLAAGSAGDALARPIDGIGGTPAAERGR